MELELMETCLTTVTYFCTCVVVKQTNKPSSSPLERGCRDCGGSSRGLLAVGLSLLDCEFGSGT